MKGLFIFGICFIGANLVYCRTIGQALDENIAAAEEDLKAAGRVVSAPFRYVGAKAKEALDNVEEGVGEVLEGAGSSLTNAGKRIKPEHAANESQDKVEAKVIAVDKAAAEKVKNEESKTIPVEGAERVENVKVVKKVD
uniref:Uncharacterized protein n=1 Tax=Panagrolaimus sp. PS1159 TaxID=55785 RepID=A0AC35FGT0_9BILA